MGCNHCGLGFTRTFPAAFAANLAGVLGPHKRVLLPLSGDGRLTLRFTATRDPKVLNVDLEDINLLLRALDLKIPGENARVPVPATLLDRDVFDLGACNGLLNVETRKLTLHLRLELTLQRFPQLAIAGIHAPISIHIIEQGHLDLAQNTFSLHAASFNISHGLMRALFVHPGTPDEQPAIHYRNSMGSPSDASISAKAIIGSQSEGNCIELGASEILICPKTPVTLCYKSTGGNASYNNGISSPSTEFGLGSQGGGHFTVNPDTSTTYNFWVDSTTKDKNGHLYRASTSVQVDIVEENMTWEMQFTPSPTTGSWDNHLTANVADPTIVVLGMQIEPCSEDGTALDELTIVHVPEPGQGGPTRSFNINSSSIQDIGVPLVGDWKVSLPGNGIGLDRVTGKVCVLAKLKC